GDAREPAQHRHRHRRLAQPARLDDGSTGAAAGQRRGLRGEGKERDGERAGERVHAPMIATRPDEGRPRMTHVQRIAHGAITELRLARPPVNALDPALCRELAAAVAGAVADGAQALVLSGGEKVFSAGLDVPYLLSLDSREAVGAAWKDFLAAARALAACPVPVAAAITGHSPAGGCVLAPRCHHRVVVDGPYRIGPNETPVDRKGVGQGI